MTTLAEDLVPDWLMRCLLPSPRLVLLGVTKAMAVEEALQVRAIAASHPTNQLLPACGSMTPLVRYRGAGLRPLAGEAAISG